MNVHRATCSCSVELYKQWFTLADFCQTGIFRGVFSVYYLPEGSAKLRWAGQGSGDILYSNMMSCPAHSRIFSKTGIYMGFSLYNIFTGRNSKAAMGVILVFRLQHCSIRVQRSSVGYSVAQKGAA